MRKLFIAILILIPTLCLGADQSGTYRNQHGDVVGSWTDHGNQRDYRDRYGDVTGSSTDYGNHKDYRDRYGDYTGSETRDTDDD
jgi:hypothetical protein